MNTLYIIGNGFDKAHGLETGYVNFRDWLRKQNYKDYIGARVFVDDIEKYTNGVYLWSDFERALGSIHSIQYLKHIIDETKSEYPKDDYLAVANAVFAKIEYIYKDQYRELIKAFRDWARDIETDGAEEVFPEMKNSDNYFFSFNYTDTLENIYDIPSEHVLHIHGYANEEKSDIIVGHNNDYNSDRYAIIALLYEELPEDGGDSVDKFIEMLNETLKNTREIILKHIRYFHELKQICIEKIVVLGHSYGEVDWPYFKTIMGVCPNAEWEMRWHSCDDYRQAKRIQENLNLPKFKFAADSSNPSVTCKCWQVMKPIIK